jgi:hypothetical protein
MGPNLKEQAEGAFGFLLKAYGAKYPKRHAPTWIRAETNFWLSTIPRPSTGIHIRTTNPIESTFATVRLRIDKIKGFLPRNTVFTGASLKAKTVILKAMAQPGTAPTAIDGLIPSVPRHSVTTCTKGRSERRRGSGSPSWH